MFTVLSWLLALGWLRQAVAALRGIPTLPDLTRMNEAVLPVLGESNGSDLTVIVPACNEEEAIEATLRSLLCSTGIRLEIVALDDRSTDRTGERMDAVASEVKACGGPHSLEVIHIRELPSGWMGKTHALHLGAKRATAPWLLFTDGDVKFDPRALRMSLRYALAEKADHLVLILTLILKTTGEAAMLAAMNALAQWSNRLWKVQDPKAWDFFGAGGFNLVRRAVYERLGGFEVLPMEVLEDLRMGWNIKRSGYAQQVVLGPGLVRIRWLQGALGVLSLTEKNAFALTRYRLGLALLSCLGLTVQVVWPPAAIAAGGWSLAAGLLTYVLIGLAYFANRRLTQVSPWLAVFYAPATAVILFAFLRSTLLVLLRNGVDWRGTRYSLPELRRNAGRLW
jgi:glycosyltransferase involved in cell wall biosynthesis